MESGFKYISYMYDTKAEGQGEEEEGGGVEVGRGKWRRRKQRKTGNNDTPFHLILIAPPSRKNSF